jgi:hypothetical protein
MSTELAQYTIFGTELVVYIGIIALILFIITASINSLNRLILEKRGKKITSHWHHWIAILAITLVIIHVAIQYI